MQNLQLRSDAVKKKTAFIIRNTSANVLKSLSPRAAHLWLTLRRLADARTGELRYPTGPFVHRARIMAEAGMRSKNTFGRYLLELRLAGLAHIRQTEEVITLPSGRKHQVYSPAQYEVSENPRQDWVSCVSQSKKPHRYSGSCVSQPCVSQKLRSRKNWDASSHTAPLEEKESHRAPGGALAFEKKKLAAQLANSLTGELSGDYAGPGDLTSNLSGLRDFYKQRAFAIGFDWKEFEKLFQQTVQRVEEELAPTPLVIAEPFVFELARLDPDCRESFLEPDGTAVLVFEHGIESMRPGASEPDWHPFETVAVA